MPAILAAVPAQDLARDRGSFYGSILGIANHILRSDLRWLERFADNLPRIAWLHGELPRIEGGGLADIAWPDLGALSPVRSNVDALIVRAFDALPEESDTALLRYDSSKGKQEKAAWTAFLHFFNHQTHHRGQVAVLLDQLSVDNDTSNLIWRF